MKFHNVKCGRCGGGGYVRAVSPDYLRQLRVNAGLGLREWARALGFSAAYVSEIELGKKPLRDGSLTALNYESLRKRKSA